MLSKIQKIYQKKSREIIARGRGGGEAKKGGRLLKGTIIRVNTIYDETLQLMEFLAVI